MVTLQEVNVIWLALFAVGALVLLFIHAKTQTEDPLLRLYPVLGWGGEKQKRLEWVVRE